MELGTFPHFRKLPKELRDSVWDLAVQEAEAGKVHMLHIQDPDATISDRIYLTPRNQPVYCYMIDVSRQTSAENVYIQPNFHDDVFWTVNQESREAVRRMWNGLERRYTSFREKAEQSTTLLREMNCIWIPHSHIAQCSMTKYLGMSQRSFSYGPDVPLEEGMRALEDLIGELCRHPELQDIPSWSEINPLFFRGEANKTTSYGLSRVVQLRECDRSFDAYTYPVRRNLARHLTGTEVGPRESPDTALVQYPMFAVRGRREISLAQFRHLHRP
jgi:hypothetical protein